jgi:hypothetical protein
LYVARDQAKMATHIDLESEFEDWAKQVSYDGQIEINAQVLVTTDCRPVFLQCVHSLVGNEGESPNAQINNKFAF